MKRSLLRTVIIGIGCLCLSACSQYVWIKPNGDPSTYGADNYNCQQNAMNSAPPVFQTYGNYPYHRHPDIIYTDCVDKRHHVKCRTIVENREYIPPPQTIDLNAGNRRDLYNACMNANGWVLQRVEE